MKLYLVYDNASQTPGQPTAILTQPDHAFEFVGANHPAGRIFQVEVPDKQNPIMSKDFQLENVDK